MIYYLTTKINEVIDLYGKLKALAFLENFVEPSDSALLS